MGKFPRHLMVCHMQMLADVVGFFKKSGVEVCLSLDHAKGELKVQFPARFEGGMVRRGTRFSEAMWG
jgi:hypothetical protein